MAQRNKIYQAVSAEYHQLYYKLGIVNLQNTVKRADCGGRFLGVAVLFDVWCRLHAGVYKQNVNSSEQVSGILNVFIDVLLTYTVSVLK